MCTWWGAQSFARGMLIGRPVVVPGLQTAEIHGNELVGVTDGEPALVLLDGHGRILSRTRLRDAGARIAVSGESAWVLGDAGQGNGIVHFRLTGG